MPKFINNSVRAHHLKDVCIHAAPVGTGGDIVHLAPMSDIITGVDVSGEATGNINDVDINKYIADIKNMDMFTDNLFDIVVVPLFFHHFNRFGYDPFLKEIYRVLKPGGLFFALEPSCLYPLTWITQSAKKVFGNITGQVDNEGL